MTRKIEFRSLDQNQDKSWHVFYFRKISLFPNDSRLWKNYFTSKRWPTWRKDFSWATQRLRTHVGSTSNYSKGFSDGGSRCVPYSRGEYSVECESLCLGIWWVSLDPQPLRSKGLGWKFIWAWRRYLRNLQNFKLIGICLWLLSVSQRTLSLSNKFKIPSLIQCILSLSCPCPCPSPLLGSGSVVGTNLVKFLFFFY